MRRDVRSGLRLEYATLSWNVVAVPVLVIAAWGSGSIAAIAFALDSAIEIAASTVVVWELKGEDGERETRALRLIGFAFFAVALYLVAQFTVAMVAGDKPSASVLAIAWTAATVLVMLGLARGKAEVGLALGNRVLQSEAKVTLVDAALAAAVLVGLVLSAAFGWWWSDPVASLVIVGYAVREGREILRHSA
jgi:divalent metal cation (Fe/Co/Zn/Cd) transporter